MTSRVKRHVQHGDNEFQNNSFYTVIVENMENKRKIVTLALNLSRNMIEETITQVYIDSDESDFEDGELDSIFEEQLGTATLDMPTSTPNRIKGYLETTIPGYTNAEFKSHFRISRTCFENLLHLLSKDLSNSFGNGRPTVDPRKQLLSVIWLLATPDSYRSVADRFDMAKSSLSHSFFRVIKALQNIAPNIIMWPTGEKLNTIKNSFYRMSDSNPDFENVLGCIDGTFIPITAPREHSENYITRKCNYAITLQGICDNKMNFIDCFAGYPGSVSDIRIFRNSSIYRNIISDPEIYFPNGEFIMGDKAYPMLPWCKRPHIDRGRLTNEEKRYNENFSKIRQTIERCFALLKGRFRRLKFLHMDRTDCIAETILSCCVLHNLCLNEHDEDMETYIREGHPYVHLD